MPASGKIGDGKTGLQSNVSPAKKQPTKSKSKTDTKDKDKKKTGDVPKLENGVTDSEKDKDKETSVSPEKKMSMSKPSKGKLSVNTKANETPTKAGKAGGDSSAAPKVNGVVNGDGDSAMMSPESL